MKKLIINTLIYGLAPYLPAFINIIMLPVITPFLTEVDYGISGTLNSYIAGLNLLSTLSITTILIPIYYKHPKKYRYIWSQAYGFLILWNFIYAILLSSILYFVIPNEAQENRIILILLIISPVVFFGPTQNIAILTYTLEQKAAHIGIRVALFGFIAIILNYVFIAIMHKGYMGWYYTAFIIGVLTNISYWIPLNIKFQITPIFSFKISRIKSILKESLLLLPHQYSYFLLDGSEKVVLNQLSINTSSIGQISVASTFSNYAGNFINASGSAFMPSLMDHFNNKRITIARNLSILWQIIVFIPCVFFCLWSKEIFHLLIKNNTLSQTYGLSIVLVMATIFRPQFSYAYNFLIYHGKSFIIWKFSFVTGITCVIANIIFVPLLGYKFVVFNSYIFFLVWSISLYFSKEFKTFNKIKNYLLVRSIFIIFITAILYLIRDINVDLKCTISIVFILSILLIYFWNKKMIISNLRP